MKKFISVLLCVILILSSLSVVAFAKDTNTLRFGEDGKSKLCKSFKRFYMRLRLSAIGVYISFLEIEYKDG